MIQFNLLPDVKLEYIKAERTKHLVISIAVLAATAALAIFVLLFLVVDGEQKKNLSDLNKDIKSSTAKVQNTPNLNKILTIQNQLSALTGLHDSKAVSSRLFGYLGQVTPANVTISSVAADFTKNTLVITGNGTSIDNINTFTDTLKFTTYNTAANPTPQKAFSAVVLTSFGRTSTGATYTISLNFDPTIFSNANSATLTVPNTVTTRSVTEQPLFNTTTPGAQ